MSGLLNPLRLCRELKRVLLARGVRVHERTPVTGVTPGPMPRLNLPGGTLAAAQVVLATDAYTPQLGLLKGQLIPIQTHIIQTERLTPVQLGRLNWPGRTPFFEASNLFNYYRLTADDRIGGGRPLYQAAAGDRQRARPMSPTRRCGRTRRTVFRRRFPALADVGIARQWAGTVGMTLDNLPLIGELAEAPGIFFAGGWNGHGVALATSSGATIADLVGRAGARRGRSSRGSAGGLRASPATRCAPSACPPT